MRSNIQSTPGDPPGDRSTPMPWGTGPSMVCPRALMRATFAAGFGPHEGLLVQLALEQCGPLWDVESDEPWQSQLECFPVRFWLAHLAAQTGEGSQHFRRTLRTLLAAEILYRAPDGSLRLNGDVAAWIHPESGRPRLVGKRVAYCLGERWCTRPPRKKGGPGVHSDPPQRPKPVSRTPLAR